MPSYLSGPGLGLSQAQNLYPTELFPFAPYDFGQNKICLNAGDELPLPAGDWYVGLGMYSILEFLDPLTNVWVPAVAAGWTSGLIHVTSDGFNCRVANRLGCPVQGVVTAPGNGSYVQSSTTISVAGSNSTWVPIIGGQLTTSSATIVTANAGAGYAVTPIALIPPPPGYNTNPNGVGGIQASGYFGIASGTVSGFTFTNPGAGYTGTTFNIIALPNPTDPNLGTGITLATVGLTVTAAGSITGVLCTNPGSAMVTPANITLTVAGAGANGTVSPVVLQTVVAASVIGGSTIAGLGGTSTLAFATTGGGAPAQGTFTNSENFLYLAGRPRPANIGLVATGGTIIAAQTGAIYDGGLFYSAPIAIGPQGQGLTATTGTVIGSSTLAYTMGKVPDVVIIQPAP